MRFSSFLSCFLCLELLYKRTWPFFLLLYFEIYYYFYNNLQLPKNSAHINCWLKRATNEQFKKKWIGNNVDNLIGYELLVLKLAYLFNCLSLFNYDDDMYFLGFSFFFFFFSQISSWNWGTCILVLRSTYKKIFMLIQLFFPNPPQIHCPVP